MAGKNEAKIKFTAETSDFTNQIKNANTALSALRAGLKLNDAELKNNGNQTDYLKNKQSLLAAELEANRSKQEALNGKLEAAKSIYGEDSQEVQQWATKLTRAKIEEQNLEAALNQCEQALQEQIAAEEKAQSPLEQMNSKIESQKRELSELVTEYKNTALEQGTNSQAANDLKGKINQLTNEIAEEEGKLREVDDALKSTDNDARSAASGGWSVLNQVIADLASNAIQQAINKLQDFARETMSLGIGFTSSMSNVQAISGATADELDALETSARELGASTQFSATEVADGFSYMAMAGWETEDMLGGISGILNLAAASGEDLANTSDIVTDALTAFGMEAGEAGDFANVLAATASSANTNVSMLGESFKYVAPVAGSLGYNVEDVNLALGMMANAGIKASTAGTSLRTLLTNMANPTDTMAKAMDDLSVSLDDGQGGMKDFRTVLNDLRSGFGELKMAPEEAAQAFQKLDDQLAAGEITEKQYNARVDELTQKAFGAEGAIKAQAAAQLAGKQGMAGLLAIINTSAEDYDKLAEAIDHSGDTFVMVADGSVMRMSEALESGQEVIEEYSGAAEAMAAVMQNNLGGDLKELSSAMDEFKLKIFESIEEPVRNVVQMVTNTVIPAMTSMLTFMQESPVLQAVITGVATALGILAGALAISSLIQAVQKAFAMLNTTMLMNPIFLVVTAIAALVAGLVYAYNHCEGFRQAVDTAFNAIRTVVLTVIETVRNTISTVFNAIRTIFSTTWNDAKNIVTTVWNGIRNAVSTAVNTVRTTVSTVFSAIRTVTQTVWNAIRTAITTPVNAARSTVVSVFNGIRSTVSSVINGIKSTVTSVFNAIKSAMTSPIESAKSTISGILSKIKGMFPMSIGRIFTNLSLPHISVSGGSAPFGIGGKGSLPKFSVSWHAKGVIFDAPTLIPTIDGVHGVGDAGPEAVSPISVLQDYVGAAVKQHMPQPIDYDKLGNKIAEAVALVQPSIKVNGREFGRLVKEVM